MTDVYFKPNDSDQLKYLGSAESVIFDERTIQAVNDAADSIRRFGESAALAGSSISELLEVRLATLPARFWKWVDLSYRLKRQHKAKARGKNWRNIR